MASANTSWFMEEFSCPICLDVLNRPVTTPCGHNFCRTCITKFKDEKVQYKCPVCNELIHTRPDLRVNTLFSEMIDTFRRSVRVKEQPCVEPAEVPEPHQRVADLKTHLLVDSVDHLEDRVCKKHDQLLALFCQTDQVYVCVLCTITDHKSHPVVPLKKEYEVKTAQLGKMQAEVQQMIQERKQKIQDIRVTVNRSKADADREMADGLQVIIALKHSVEKWLEDLNQTVQEKLKSTEKQADGLIKELEQEIEDLTNRSSEVKQLSHTEDDLHFLRAFRSLKDPPPTRDWTTVEVRPQSYVGTLRSSLDQLEETLNKEMKMLYACELTLDPNTAYKELSLSEDNRKVTKVEEDQSYPDHPDRFDYWDQVLCREALTGRCYWEVEWKGTVFIGVTCRGITRSGKSVDSRLGEYNKSWILECEDDGGDGRYFAWHNKNVTIIRLPPAGSHRVGVYLDRPAGTLSFYRVSPGGGGSSDTLTHIHTFQTSFTQEDLLPAFRFWGGQQGDPVSLCKL